MRAEGHAAGRMTYFGTSKTKVYSNSRPPAAIAAVRAARWNRSPTPQAAIIGPNMRPKRSVSMRVPANEPTRERPEDRLHRTKRCRSNLSQVLGAWSSPDSSCDRDVDSRTSPK